MLRFYDVDEKYVLFLKGFDSKIPNITYSTNNKFVCGIVLDVNGINYYAPISHVTKKQQTSIQITNKGKVIASIRFSFMFPAPNEVLKIKDFENIRKQDHKYADLLSAEYIFCSRNEKKIRDKAATVYKIGCNPNHRLHGFCCDFLKLEAHYKDYLKP